METFLNSCNLALVRFMPASYESKYNDVRGLLLECMLNKKEGTDDKEFPHLLKEYNNLNI